MNVKDASDRLARWALLLQQYDFNIALMRSDGHVLY